MPTSIFTKTSIAKMVRVTMVTSALYGSSIFAANLNEIQNYNIGSGQLSAALNQFAAQTGLFLSADSKLLRNKNTTGVSGSSTGLSALNALLLGTGLTFSVGVGGSVTVIREGEVIKDEEGVNLPVLLIEGSKSITAGKSTIDAEEIDFMAGGDGHLTDLLQGNGAVRYSLTSSASANNATMRPDEISIHGQSHYQNSYIIDGVAANNDLNPGDSEDTYTNPVTITANAFGMLTGSSSQAYYVDPDALDSVTVYDSNVPAEYGGFLGGVVSSRLKRYDEDSFSIKYAVSRDEWDEIHVDEETEEDYEDADVIDGSYTPEYLKQRLTLTGKKGLAEDTGLTFTASRATSQFAQIYNQSFAGTDFGDTALDYEDTIDNAMIRLDHRVNNSLDVGMSVLYANRYHDGVTSDTYDSNFVKSHQSVGVGFNSDYHVNKGTLKAKLSYSEKSDNLDSDESTFIYHQADYYAGNFPYSGGYGDINQQQDTTELSLDWEHDTFSFIGMEHDIKAGVTLNHQTMFYETESDIAYQYYRCSTTGCTDYSDEYLWIERTIDKNKLEISGHSVGTYLSDRFTVGDWAYYLGVRADYNSTLENIDFSPRANATWDVFGDKSTQLISGASRYYGRSFFRYEVNNQLRTWYNQTRYNSDGSVSSVTEYDDTSLSDYDLKTPYSDELMIGAIQHFGNVNATLKLVGRESKDIVTSAETDDGYDYYDNEGESTSFNTSLEFTTRDPLKLGITETHATFAISYQKSDSNSTSDVTYEDEISTDSVYYDGQIIYESELPSFDYNIPFAVNFSTTTEIPNWRLTLANRINVKAGGTVAVDSKEDYTDVDGEEYDIYEDVDFNSLITLDTTVTWRPQVFEKMEGSIKLSVNNVFDKYVDMSTSSSSNSYTTGRTFSLELGAYF
ncbi:TonB-dependent receptor [Marinomonas colpomeniae]|uniref:TonB-dependent receptor plug domain-containing protein n=1 Tax=Marinomonas colpomeniae TaxID=2774408 RepID=A0ABR8P1Q9_9GAMM|nr:TonB-dependent receptor plug domain-containing protein [Marinomonas colpomeniae]MBD5771242.1 TonB-dependent receptor plug domain-containing protein [Marinomonas colpomeniae]